MQSLVISQTQENTLFRDLSQTQENIIFASTNDPKIRASPNFSF